MKFTAPVIRSKGNNLNDPIKLSKTLCFVLRHRPQALKLTPDEFGYVKLDDLISGFTEQNKTVTLQEIMYVVETDDKKRFAISEDSGYIRAVQGHSFAVNEMAFSEEIPPGVLYHGTASGNLESIFQEGLTPGSRQFVHLTDHIETARVVGLRYAKKGSLVVLSIDTVKVLERGYAFYKAINGVWLVKHVPVGCFKVEEKKE